MIGKYVYVIIFEVVHCIAKSFELDLTYFYLTLCFQIYSILRSLCVAVRSRLNYFLRCIGRGFHYVLISHVARGMLPEVYYQRYFARLEVCCVSIPSKLLTGRSAFMANFDSQIEALKSIQSLSQYVF